MAEEEYMIERDGEKREKKIHHQRLMIKLISLL